MKEKKIVSLFQFIKTGKFGNVELGKSRQWVRENFSKPDDMTRMFQGCYIGDMVFLNFISSMEN